MRFYRTLFSLAALYNFAFGIWAGFFPEHFFTLFRLVPPQYPSLWACLGMVVGIYALAYAYVAWRPQKGDFLIALGLLGKVLGPIGWLLAVRRGEFPPRTFFLILANDLVWWFPFLFYLLRNVPWRGRTLTVLVVSVHGAACLAWLVGKQAPFHSFSWILTWVLWILSALSLPAFLTIWILHLRHSYAAKSWIWLGLAIGLLGVAFDVWGNLIFLAWLPEPSRTLREIEWGFRTYYQLSPGVANGFYCLGGILLSLVSWKCGFLKGWKGTVGFLMWIVGFSLTWAAFSNHPSGIAVTGGLTMVLFIPWAAWVGWEFKQVGA